MNTRLTKAGISLLIAMTIALMAWIVYPEQSLERDGVMLGSLLFAINAGYQTYMFNRDRSHGL